MDTTKTVTHISLCAGYGGIDLGLKRAIPSLRTVAVSEIEAFACANLVAKMEAGCLDPAPIWTDVKTFPWASFHGKVDILSGGYPCQPFSAAGKRLGKDDPRHLWPWIADGIRVLQPALCFFENVEGHISLGLRDVIGELEESGYRATWGLFSAAEVGAPHQRKRVFILAHKQHQGSQGWLQRWTDSQREGFDGHAGCCGSSDRVWPSRPGQPQHEWEPPRVVGGLAHTAGQRSGSESGDALHERRTTGETGRESLPQDAGWQVGSPISDDQSTGGDGEPPRVVGNASQYDGGHLSERHRAFGSKQSSGRQTEPALGGNADGPASGMDYAELCLSGDNRTDELRLLGNGVVPATAERAFRVLSARFTA